MLYSLQSAAVVKIRSRFEAVFGGEAVLAQAPGRVNIIGEHTDYNNGFVLPAAIDKAVFVAVQKRADREIHLYAGDFDAHYQTTIEDMRPLQKSTWPNYTMGVVKQLAERGYNISGFNAVIDGEVPLGSGMSSSAAVSCAMVTALDALFGLHLKPQEMAEIGQLAEHTFAGVMSGIMDQFASVFGRKDHVIKLDCRSLAYEYVPLKMTGMKLVLFNTNVKHSLASTEYNTRRKECAEGVHLVQHKYPEVQSLRDATMEMLDTIVKPADAVIYRRCRYVLEENARLQIACDALKAGRLEELGRQMFASHRGLRDDYEVSCKELDFLVEKVSDNPAVLGARMMGGGFGGCTINLVREEAIDALVAALSEPYRAEMKLNLTTYIVQTADGAGVIS